MNVLSGEYQPMEGQAICLNCSAGSYSENSGAANCSLCDKGHYQNETGSSSCAACSEGTYCKYVSMPQLETKEGDFTIVPLVSPLRLYLFRN